MRKICVITATRAEYGLLKPLMKAIQMDEELSLQVISTGTHLSPEFGLTNTQIEIDGFEIDKKIEILLSSDTPIGISKTMGLAQISFSEAFYELNPDLIVVLGDRYEILSIVSIANIFQIPVAHFSGGELTEGAIDEKFRHAITKLSSIHFTALDEYSNRVIQMGEQPCNVFNVGEIGLSQLSDINYLKKGDLEKSLGINFLKKNLLFTFHPETNKSVEENINDIKVILESLSGLDDTFIIFTKSNADVGGRIINKMIDDHVAKNNKTSSAYESLGRDRYLSALKYVDAVIGNSSSGIVEAPSFKIATINIGDRQKGRIRSDTVIDVSADSEQIQKAIKYIYSSEFKKISENAINRYFSEKSIDNVINVIKSVDIKKLKTKVFYDLHEKK